MNIPICTHLSNQILLNQSFSGSEEPGSVNKTVEIISHPMAGSNEGFVSGNEENFLQYKGRFEDFFGFIK